MKRITRNQATKYAFDWRDEPLLEVDPGEAFAIETWDASTGYFKSEADLAIPGRELDGTGLRKQRRGGEGAADRVTVRNLRILGVDKDDNLLVVEGAVPGPKDGYVLINKAKKPPRERRGFAGATTLDPLKAAKKAAAGKSKK